MIIGMAMILLIQRYVINMTKRPIDVPLYLTYYILAWVWVKYRGTSIGFWIHLKPSRTLLPNDYLNEEWVCIR